MAEPVVGQRKLWLFQRTWPLNSAVVFIYSLGLVVLAMALATREGIEVGTITATIEGLAWAGLILVGALNVPTLIAVSGNAVEHLARALSGVLTGRAAAPVPKE